MLKKWFLTVIISFAILCSLSFVLKNTKISFDKDSKYKAELPKTMRSAIIKNGDDKDLFKNVIVQKVPLPEVGSRDVLVYVKSATFTQRDFVFFKLNKGRKQFVPCSDFSGIVVKVGEKVKIYEVGDRVFGISDLNNVSGACADYISVPENNIYTIPYSLTFKQASMIPTPALLNWFAVHNLQKNGIKTGKVLIDDAMSEVGIMLTGLLVKNGFEVTAIDDDYLESWASNYGVKEFISNSKFLSKKESLKNKYDIVINLKNGISMKELVAFVKPKGTFISYEPADIKRNDIRTLIIDNRLIDKDIFAKMARLVHLGKLQVQSSKEYGLEHIRDAYMFALKGNNNGKVVVNVNK